MLQDCNENKLASTVVCPGLKFDDVGALDHVKKALYETVILPLKRPELFSGGKMLKVCNLLNWLIFSIWFSFLFIFSQFQNVNILYILPALQRSITFWTFWDRKNSYS